MQCFVPQKTTKDACSNFFLSASRPIEVNFVSSSLWKPGNRRRGKEQRHVPLSSTLYVIIACLLCSYLLSHSYTVYDLLQVIKKRQVAVPLLSGGIMIFAGIVTALVVSKLKYVERRKALEQIIETYKQSGPSLIRYVMLNRQCSEERAYQRLKTFVKNHVPFYEHGSIDRMFAQDRQYVVDMALGILCHCPDEIDNI